MLVRTELSHGSTYAFKFAAFNSKHGILRAFVSRDHAELGTENAIEYGRDNAVRRTNAGATADDQFLREKIRSSFTFAFGLARHTRLGKDVAASQFNCRGSPSTFA